MQMKRVSDNDMIGIAVSLISAVLRMLSPMLLPRLLLPQDHPDAALPELLPLLALTSLLWLSNVSWLCSIVTEIKHNIFILVVGIILEFPASPEVIIVGGYIVDSADPTCTEEEIASLVESESSLEEAAEFLSEALEEAQANLLGIGLVSEVI